MSEFRQQEGGFVAEEAVVADFAGEIGISALSPGFPDEEVARPATECHFSHRFDRRVVVTQRLHAEGVGNKTQEICLTHRFGQHARHAASADTAGLRLQEGDIAKPKAFCHDETHAAQGVVEVRVGGIDCHIFFHGFHDAAFNQSFARDATQRAEQQGMVSHHQVASFPNCLVKHGFRHVKA